MLHPRGGTWLGVGKSGDRSPMQLAVLFVGRGASERPRSLGLAMADTTLVLHTWRSSLCCCLGALVGGVYCI